MNSQLNYEQSLDEYNLFLSVYNSLFYQIVANGEDNVEDDK